MSGDAGGTTVHDHDRDHGWRVLFREVFRPHSHDAADSIDTALEASDRGIRAVKVSFVALMVTALIQVAVVLVTGSVALLADTIHNFSDALTAVPLFIAFRLGRRPATRRYSYGFRRAEDLAGLFIIAMIALSAVVAGWQAIDRLIDPRPLENIGVLFVAGIVGLVGNELVALYRIREGRAIGSAALIADGYHARTDGFTSLAVALGALGVWAGFERADPVAGLAISVAIFVVLVAASRQIYYRLMDAVDPEVLDRVEQVAHASAGDAAGDFRVRWMGHRLHADVVLTLDGSRSLEDGARAADDLRELMVDKVPHLADVDVRLQSDRP